MSLLTLLMPKRSRDAEEVKGDFQAKLLLSQRKLHMLEDSQLVDYLLLLRFGTCEVGQASRPILNLASISKITKKPLSTIRDLIKLGIDSKLKEFPIQRRKRMKLEIHHVDYLCNQTTLNQWAHLSLIQRTVMFHRTFPEIKISASLL